jgi:hypothetical protein
MRNVSGVSKADYLNDLLNFRRSGDTVLWLRWTLFATILITAAAWWQFRQLAVELGISIPGSWKWTAAFIFGIIAILTEIAVLVITWTRLAAPVLNALERIHRFLQRLRVLNLAGFLVLLFPFPLILLGPSGEYLVDFAIRLFLLWMIAIAGGSFLISYRPGRSWFEILGVTLLLYTIAYRLALFIPEISAFPFSLGYSEGSRYYYASLFMPGRVYGNPALSPPPLHPSRYLLQSIPFLLKGASIEWHRAWQVFLWIGTTVLAAYGMVRRLRIPDRFARILWLAWAILFILQGPVYYHLLIMVILVLWGARSDRWQRTFFVVVIASIWAGISRINWIPVPGLLAAAIYILETKRGARGALKYGQAPLIWVAAGTIAGLLTHQLYGALAPSGTDWLTSIQNSPLLFYRLLPNPTFEAGVLLAAAFAAAPLLAVALRALARRPHLWGFFRAFSLLLLLLALFLGGLLVSAKIGGGDDLHNMDAFLTHLMVVGSYVIFRRDTPDAPEERARPTTNWIAFSWVLIVPVIFALGRGGPSPAPDMKGAGVALARIQDAVDGITADGGEVLFISQRHLLSFGLIDGVELIPEYEKTFLMEMAMSGNEDYFHGFRSDLEQGKYALIIVEKQNKVYKDREYVFGDEDNAWVKHVSVPLLEWYEPFEILDLGLGRVALMRPKPDGGS